MARKLKNGAQELFNDFKQFIDDIFKWIEEVLGGVKKEGKFNIKSFLESEALTEKELVEWETKIKIFSKTKCRLRIATNNKAILKFMEKENSLAFFDANEIPPIIWYKEGITEYVISHEFYHLEEFEKIGKKAFLDGVFGTVKEWHINNILREKYVYERILENASKFSEIELNEAKRYYASILQDAVNNGNVEIIADYLVKIN